MRNKILYIFTLIILFGFLFALASCDNSTSDNKEYIVSFNTNGGTEIEPQHVLHGDRIKKPDDPKKAGHVFVKWTYSGEDWSFIKDFVTGDMTLDANWSSNSYSLALNNNNSDAGSVSGSGNFNCDSKVTINASANAGYAFAGWYNGDNKVSSQENYSFNMPAENLSYTARWVANTNTPYKVEHYLQNETDGGYPDTPFEVDNLTGTTGTLTNGEVNTYDGFISPEITQVNINGDGSTAIKLYYARNLLKFGFILLHDEKSNYDKNFIEAAKTACKNKGVQAVFKTNVSEDEKCYSTAIGLVNSGCIGVFADSFGHEPFILRAAKEFTNVQFAHASGTMAHTEKLDNFHNAFANIYEGRYITGVAAGMKLNDMIANGAITASQAVIGYIGAFPYAEVISGYTAFYLGAKSVCPSVTMTVRYTNSWYDETAENATCRTLIDTDKCVLISQHSDSLGAYSVCESKKVINVSYNSEYTTLTNSYLTSSRINWVPFFEYFIENTLNGNKMPYDWCGSLANGSVEYYGVNAGIAATGTLAKMDETANKIKNGTLDVFDTNTFTVSNIGNGTTSFINLNVIVDANGRVTSYMADVDTDDSYMGDTQVIEDGVFKESKFRSAPYFDLRIDGITELKN